MCDYSRCNRLEVGKALKELEMKYEGMMEKNIYLMEEMGKLRGEISSLKEMNDILKVNVLADNKREEKKRGRKSQKNQLPLC
ncbi:MAG: hypothetical protein WC309_01870 [Candidatus Paceibacterota bacterium]|jgi:hypothetical protein